MADELRCKWLAVHVELPRSLDDVDYSRGSCPVAEALTDPTRSRSLLLPSNEGVGEADAGDMARAIRKVARHYAR